MLRCLLLPRGWTESWLCASADRIASVNSVLEPDVLTFEAKHSKERVHVLSLLDVPPATLKIVYSSPARVLSRPSKPRAGQCDSIARTCTLGRKISEHPAGRLGLRQSESFTLLGDSVATKIADSDYLAPHNANSRTSQAYLSIAARRWMWSGCLPRGSCSRDLERDASSPVRTSRLVALQSTVGSALIAGQLVDSAGQIQSYGFS
jgi:hypothetical protein